MGVKEMLLEGLKPALTEQIKVDIAAGRLVQPVDFAEISKNVWKHLRMNVTTAGAITVFRIKSQDIDDVLRDVFKSLNIITK